ncbi:Uma2 family endonuclease [Thalassoroseus pseudoceratinae]|uniref:Uma2 family endonuclease n=1 Tax=Thalassoroseus pseudoceratinae TaxID=2713176 RepID=UPI0014230505|nr:Uma2 family endonuclease [Thalassoroseus pseudoceratinae]
MAEVVIAQDSTVLSGDRIVIPGDIHSLADFRAWALSDDFPKQGRIDYIQGRIEVDMSPENLFSHGSPKSEIVRVFGNLNRRLDLGYLFTDCTRFANAEVGLSAEPDVILLTRQSLTTGEAHLRRAASGEDDQFVEIDGMADLVVEIVSDSSVRKDTVELFATYFTAGVIEYWIIDVRGPAVQMQIYTRGETEFVPVPHDDGAFQTSSVFDLGFRLERARDELGHWTYQLVETNEANE